jgi:hypothetical protein
MGSEPIDVGPQVKQRNNNKIVWLFSRLNALASPYLEADMGRGRRCASLRSRDGRSLSQLRSSVSSGKRRKDTAEAHFAWHACRGMS